MANEDKKVLSYGDVVLWSSDVQLLCGNHFLNDRVIEFFFAQLETPYSRLLLSPAITFLVSQCSDAPTLLSIVEPLHLTERQVIMFTVNDNEDVNMVGGGYHWSLLVYHRDLNKFEHYDSMGGMNARHAKKLASTFRPFLGPDAVSANFEEAWTPHQVNGHDCGVYVMAVAQVLCEAYTVGPVDCQALIKEKVTPTAITQMRAHVLQKILSLSKEQKRCC
ncbi:hypothetical protein L7F22_022808 [Adiantum nelumboides]|nr:hypothetical protein [Adiantum nelumboides]